MIIPCASSIAGYTSGLTHGDALLDPKEKEKIGTEQLTRQELGPYFRTNSPLGLSPFGGMGPVLSNYGWDYIAKDTEMHTHIIVLSLSLSSFRKS